MIPFLLASASAGFLLYRARKIAKTNILLCEALSHSQYQTQMLKMQSKAKDMDKLMDEKYDFYRYDHNGHPLGDDVIEYDRLQQEMRDLSNRRKEAK